MTRDEWLRAHAWLDPLARFLARIEAALAAVPIRAPGLPRWDDYAADYAEGIPLLRSAAAAVDLLPAGATVCALLDGLAVGPAPDGLTAGAVALRAELAQGLGHGPRPAQRVVDWLLGEGDFTPSSPGLLRHLGWTAMTRDLQPVLAAFARWRNEDRWLRSVCPACGSPPAMAQLVGIDPGRMRFLVCGCCGSRWRFKRMACPFCEIDTQRLGVVAVQSEPGLRLDHCESCRAYLKTYDGQGNEGVLLLDWTTLHLDALAAERGLKRMAASLYDLEGLVDRPGP